LAEHGGTEHREERNEEELAAARRKVSDVFDALGIPYEIVLHPPIFSAFDNVRQEIKIDALICKNLFLRNKDKSRYYLFTLPLDKRADLALLQSALGETRLSFGSADALWELLRIHPGTVSLLNIIGASHDGYHGDGYHGDGYHGDGTFGNHGDGTFDRQAYQKYRPRDCQKYRPRDSQHRDSLKFLLDAEVLDVPLIGVHPNDNGATIVFPPDRLKDIFERYEADFDFISLN